MRGVAVAAGIQSASRRECAAAVELRGQQTLARRPLIEIAGVARLQAKSHTDSVAATAGIAISVELAR